MLSGEDAGENYRYEIGGVEINTAFLPEEFTFQSCHLILELEAISGTVSS